jgi:hypothetical protein
MLVLGGRLPMALCHPSGSRVRAGGGPRLGSASVKLEVCSQQTCHRVPAAAQQRSTRLRVHSQERACEWG